MSETGDPSDDLFLGYEAAASQLFERIERACRRPDEWSLRVRAAVGDVLALLAADPRLARTLLVEPYTAARGVQARHEETLTRLGALLRSGRENTTESLPEVLEEGLVGGVVFIVGGSLRAGHPERLPDLGPELTALILTPYLGREEAEQIAGGE